jgi:hypothetical protein
MGTLDKDPRYKRFRERYMMNLSLFAYEICKSEPTWQQQLMFDSVESPGSRTTVRSGHSTGKSRGIGVAALWHLLCYPKSNTVLTAPRIDQVRSVVWKEMEDIKHLIAGGPGAWLNDFYTIETEKIFVNEHKLGWFIEPRTAPIGRPENLAGYHRDWLLVIADEASGIPDANYKTLNGALTHQWNRMLLTSQPTRPSGYFYDTHRSLSTIRGGSWNSFCFNSEESPFVSSQWLLNAIMEYGSRDDPEYMIRVRGEFPNRSDKYLLSRIDAEKTFEATKFVTEGRQYGNLVLIDVSAGEYRDYSAVGVARVEGYESHGPDARRMDLVDIPIWDKTIQPVQLARRAHMVAQTLYNANILVDAGGMGVVVAQELENLGNNVIRVLWGKPNFKRRLQERFVNQRAQAMYSASRAAKEGRMTIKGGRWKSAMLDQMSRIPYTMDDRARYVVAKKGSKEWEGLPSPDLWDMVSFGFLEGAVYNVSQSALESAMVKSAQQKLEEEADAAFAGIG